MTLLEFREQLKTSMSHLYQNIEKEGILAELKMVYEAERMKESVTHGESHHYQRMAIQPIQVIESWLTNEQFQGFLLGSVLKYIGRYNQSSVGKGGIADLRKAMDYLEWLIDAADETGDSDGVQDEEQEG